MSLSRIRRIGSEHFQLCGQVYRTKRIYLSTNCILRYCKKGNCPTRQIALLAENSLCESASTKNSKSLEESRCFQTGLRSSLGKSHLVENPKNNYIFPTSAKKNYLQVRHFRNYEQAQLVNSSKLLSDDTTKSERNLVLKTPCKVSETRINPLGIQMISSNLFNQLFGAVDSMTEMNNSLHLQFSIDHLIAHKLWGKSNSLMKDVELKLPTLTKNSIEGHFRTIAEEQLRPYKMLLNQLINGRKLPDIPSKFVLAEGWTKYLADGSSVSVKYPDSDILVLDVEVCVTDGQRPTLAAAVSGNHWYTWVSKHLLNADKENKKSYSEEVKENCKGSKLVQELKISDLIPLGKASKGSPHRLVIGHNISYDRIRIQDDYFLADDNLRFLDTMSLHIAVGGLVHEQRMMLAKNNTAEKKTFLPWMKVGCANNLSDVHKFYCKSKGLEKDPRDYFISGSLPEIYRNFHDLMRYCVLDVKATHEVLLNILPLFYDRCPHPVTFSGILEMGSCYLPVNENWLRYAHNAETEYNRLQSELTEILKQRAFEALSMLTDKKYLKDPWLWNLDWNVSERRKRARGLPNWYVNLCSTTDLLQENPVPSSLTTSLRIVPKLLRLTWKGYPLHHELSYGWGYLKPTFVKDAVKSGEKISEFPYEEFFAVCPVMKEDVEEGCESSNLSLTEQWESYLYGEKKTVRKLTLNGSASQYSDDDGRPIDIGIPGVEFYRLPHKNGPNNNVGNPLAKDFLSKIEQGILSSNVKEIAEVALKTTKIVSYWKNARDRILSQKVVWLDSPKNSAKIDDQASARLGAILPQVVVCGTVTRRAVEPTWLTASNPRRDRIGSELKAMVTAPPGYHFVGADVDSQELWIAALLGDSYFARIHGCTAMSWMTLQGNKTDGTDLHSKTAATANITREQAKVINYARIYGGGKRFMKTLLSQYNPSLSPEDAEQNANAIMTSTKGYKGWRLSKQARELFTALPDMSNTANYVNNFYLRKQILAMIKALERSGFDKQSFNFEDFIMSPPGWVGGSESYTFNCLESIVRDDHPVSPVLGAAIPRPLEPQYAGDNYMTSRINWVVQSSAVDYLHTMTVCMKWLAKKYDIDMRFCISIHDEVRYLVHSKDIYRAALALQVTNLLTRALFAERLGMPDLPMSVAFFSAVDIDKVLRKDPTDPCITPSNPNGLYETYGVPNGTSLSIYDVLKHVRTLHKGD